MKYTFEDWLDGLVTDINSLHLQYVMNREQGTNEPCLPDDEYEKIIQAKKRAFDWAVEITLHSMSNQAEGKSDKWTEIEIQKTEKFIKENPDLEQKYEEGYKDTNFINGSDYRAIQRLYEKFEQGHHDQWVGIPSKDVPSRLFEMYLCKQYLKWLKKRRGKQDGRKNNKKGEFIEPESAFWDEVNKWNVSAIKNSRGNPREDTIDSLLKGDYRGYTVSDKFKENPIPLTYSTIRGRLIEYIDKNG